MLRYDVTKDAHRVTTYLKFIIIVTFPQKVITKIRLVVISEVISRFLLDTIQ